jgi:hypothetical protein
MRLVTFALIALALTGCQTPSNYYWGGYENMLYQGYKDPGKMADMKLGLESYVKAMDDAKQKVAPGLFAELGTLYLDSGEADKAVIMYARERDAWPESKYLMDTLIKNIERKKVVQSEAKK